MLALFAAGFSAQRATAGERVHYSFGHLECPGGGFTQWAAPKAASALTLWSESTAYEQRLQRPEGLGARCLDGRNGVVLNASCCCDARAAGCPSGVEHYAPLSSPEGQEANFGYGMRDGLTLEMWLRPAVKPTRQVILALGLQNPSAPLACGTAGSGPYAGLFTEEASFVLSQNEIGCVELDIALSTGVCARLPGYANYCQVQGFPRLDDSAMHHLVVTLSYNLHDAPVASAPTRFALYIDGIRVIDADDPPNIGKNLDILYMADLGSLTARAVLNNYAPLEYAPHTLWNPNQVLRIGSDGYTGTSAGAPSPWEGEVAMLAMYGRPLLPAEVKINRDASVDNSAPVATETIISVPEDSCTALPRLEGLASDVDNRPPLNRSQSLRFFVDVSSLEAGGLFADAACTAPLPRTGLLPYAPPLYFRAAQDDFSLPGEGAYASLRWTVSDLAPSFNGTDEARVAIRVDPVNDRPVPIDVAVRVYLGLATRITFNGTDVDGEDPSAPIARARVVVASAPAYGEVRAVLPDGTAGAPLGVGDSVPNATIFYRTTYDFGDTSGIAILGKDSFRYRLRDAGGLESATSALVEVTILSGLDAIPGASEVWEEVPTVIELRGINQRASQPELAKAATVFTVTGLPRHGSLWQFDAAGYGGRGARINSSGTQLRDSTRPCPDAPSFLCPRLLYEGERDFFSRPTHTRGGLPLNASDDYLVFTVGTVGETSPNATQAVVVKNVNDPAVLLAPANASYLPNIVNFVARGISVADPDRGVGVYRVEFKVLGPGGVTQAGMKQPASAKLSWASWQSSVAAARTLLGYCPHACSDSLNCLETCTEGNGYNDATLRLFVAEDVLPALLHSLQFTSEAFASATDSLALRVTVEDFDDGAGLGQNAGAHTASLELPLIFSTSACTSRITASCLVIAGSGSGIISWAIGTGALLIVISACCFVRKRQRTRVRKYDVGGRRRLSSVRGRDMRIWLPLWSVTCLLAHLLLFLARCVFSPYTLMRMDVWGNGVCGANATLWTETNHGCASGYPQGFRPDMSLGDALLLGVLGPLGALELDGRRLCRLRCSLWALVWFLLVVAKFSLYRTWEKGVPDYPWSYHDEFTLALGEELRPMQNSMVSLIFLVLGIPPLFIMGAICCVSGGARLRRCRGEAEESGGSDAEPEGEGPSQLIAMGDFVLDVRRIRGQSEGGAGRGSVRSGSKAKGRPPPPRRKGDKKPAESGTSNASAASRSNQDIISWRSNVDVYDRPPPPRPPPHPWSGAEKPTIRLSL